MFDSSNEVGQSERLGDEREFGASAIQRGIAWISGDKNDFHFGALGPESKHQFRPAHPWHENIGNYQIEVMGRSGSYSVTTIDSRHDGVSPLFENLANQTPNCVIVLHHQYRPRTYACRQTRSVHYISIGRCLWREYRASTVWRVLFSARQRMVPILQGKWKDADNMMSNARTNPTERPILRQSRLILRAGFGGLLLLMALAGVNAVQVLWHIQSRNEEIQHEFLVRNRALNQIRSDVYLSGTYVRDYLLEPERANAEKNLQSLDRVHREMDIALKDYSRLLTTRETVPFGGLRRSLEEYWTVLKPVMMWTPEQRRLGSFAFLRDEVFPRRLAMLGLADQIAILNEQQLQAANVRISGLFSQFRTRLILTVLATLGLGLLLAMISIRRILDLEQAAASRYKEVEHARGELKSLSASLVQAQENERRSISRELHDEVGQSLSALMLGLANLSAGLRSESADQLQRHVDGLRKLAELSVGVVRNMALLLRPSMLDDLGLLAALQWQARETSRQTGMLVSVAAEGVSDDLPDQHKTCIYRVVQEALHNCSRHAAAKTVRIAVEQRQDELSLTIQDDGKGFNPRSERGLGLLGIHERIANLGGVFLAESEPGRGTLLAIKLPVRQNVGARTEYVGTAS